MRDVLLHAPLPLNAKALALSKSGDVTAFTIAEDVPAAAAPPPPQ